MFLSDNPPVSTQRKTNPEPSPVAARIRARVAELGHTESSFSEAIGWQRTVLSTMLRRMDRGLPGLSPPTLAKLEKHLGKPVQWILKGEESEGIALRDVEGWAEARAAAAERYGIASETLDLVGQMRFPVAPTRLDAPSIAALARFWLDTR